MSQQQDLTRILLLLGPSSWSLPGLLLAWVSDIREMRKLSQLRSGVHPAGEAGSSQKREH